MRIFLILILLPCLAFAQNDTINVLDSKGLKQGVWTKKHDNGKTRYIGQFVNDKPTGTFKYYDNYGVLTGEITHLQKDSASCIFYHDGTNILSKGMYHKMMRTGNWKFFDGQGDITSQSIYLKGIKNGPSRIYYKDGQIAREENYKNGVLDGTMLENFSNGNIKFKGTYTAGNLDGDVIYYHPNGNKKLTGYYQYAVREKTWRYYDSDEKLQYVEFYKEGYLKWRKTPEELNADKKSLKNNLDSLNSNIEIKE